MLTVSSEFDDYMRAMFTAREAICCLFRTLTEGQMYLVTVPDRTTYTMYESERECDSDFGRICGAEPLYLPSPPLSTSEPVPLTTTDDETVRFYGRFDGFGTRARPVTLQHALLFAESWTNPTSSLPGMIFTVAKDTDSMPFGTTVILNRGQYQSKSYFAATFQLARVHSVAYVVDNTEEV